MTEAERVEWVQRVLRFLNYEKRRCTYGTLAKLIGVSHQTVAKYLGKRRRGTSWVVYKDTGRPKDYTPDQIADGVLTDPKAPIVCAEELRQLVTEFDQVEGGTRGDDSAATDQCLPEARETTDGFLTTHVLNTALGKPAAGLTITLYRLGEKESRIELASKVTNSDGRTDTPILPRGRLEVGQYELIFCAGDYFDALEKSPQQRFLDDIPIRFGIADADSHYHVPLLLSPFGYSTYRGS